LMRGKERLSAPETLKPIMRRFSAGHFRAIKI
jgi:hypothetical protein